MRNLFLLLLLVPSVAWADDGSIGLPLTEIHDNMPLYGNCCAGDNFILRLPKAPSIDRSKKPKPVCIFPLDNGGFEYDACDGDNFKFEKKKETAVYHTTDGFLVYGSPKASYTFEIPFTKAEWDILFSDSVQPDHITLTKRTLAEWAAQMKAEGVREYLDKNE
jgi:hypothetical protein